MRILLMRFGFFSFKDQIFKYFTNINLSIEEGQSIPRANEREREREREREGERERERQLKIGSKIASC